MNRPTRRGWIFIVCGLTTLVLLAVALLLPVPYVKLSPGPTFNVIGTVDGKPVVAISGTQTYPTTGALDMTTVSELGGPRRGLTFVDALASWFNPSVAVLPTRLLFPEDLTADQVKQRQQLAFDTSQSEAVAAAMRYLNRPLTTQVIVTSVDGDAPADGKLQPRDEIVSVDGQAIKHPADVVAAVRAKPIGTTFDIAIVRTNVTAEGAVQGGSQSHVTVTSTQNPDDATKPYLGIGVGEYYSAGFPIEFTLQDIGGPSAGTMFAIGIIDKLTPSDLARGHHIAGTGTIDADGTVGAIGGIRQKLAGARNAGAELFLMPEVHCDEAADHLPEGLRVVPIKTLADGVRAIENWTAGKAVASCPATAS